VYNFHYVREIRLFSFWLIVPHAQPNFASRVHALLWDNGSHLRYVPAASQALATARGTMECRGTGPELLRLTTVLAPQDTVYHRSTSLRSSRYHTSPSLF
jgi:hypothetical protein